MCLFHRSLNFAFAFIFIHPVFVRLIQCKNVRLVLNNQRFMNVAQGFEPLAGFHHAPGWTSSWLLCRISPIGIFSTDFDCILNKPIYFTLRCNLAPSKIEFICNQMTAKTKRLRNFGTRPFTLPNFKSQWKNLSWFTKANETCCILSVAYLFDSPCWQ